MSIRDIEFRNEEVKLQMTSMIDVIFLLLAFFVITYRTPTLEGDFNIKMPVATQSNNIPQIDDLTPITIRLASNPQGELTGVWFGSKPLGLDFRLLRQLVFERLVTGNTVTLAQAEKTTIPVKLRDDLEIELDCDSSLRYKYTMQAITAVTGYLNAQNQIVPLVEKVKFTPPNK